MPLLPLYGHRSLRERLRRAVARGTLPASLLVHGPAGIGKQRLALWLGQLILCEDRGSPPCGVCTSCRYAMDLVHPDLHWFFPRPRLADASAGADDVLADYGDAIADRVKSGGVYPRPSGSEGIYVAAVRAIVQSAGYTPSLGRRKVFVVGDAERMVPQEGSEMAANAFLKLLEEPAADTTIIITSSEAGALLPTIRSRVVSLRASPLAMEDMEVFASDPAVLKALGTISLEQIRAAGGAPGVLIGSAERQEAIAAARAFLDAALGSRDERLRAVLGLGSSRARGFFSEMLDALTALLHDRLRTATEREDTPRALGAARAIDAVEEAKTRAAGNVNPQLIGAAVAKELAESLG